MNAYHRVGAIGSGRFPRALAATMLLAALGGGGQIGPHHIKSIEPDEPTGPTRHDLERIAAAQAKRARKAARNATTPATSTDVKK